MSENQQGDPNFAPKIIWGALTFSQAIYLGIALFVIKPSAEQIESMANSPIPMALFGVGLMSIVMGTFVIPQIIKAPENPTKPEELQSQRIVQWAIIEGGVIMGLVTVFLGGPNSVLIGLYVIALFAMLKTFPTDLVIESEAE